jgi:hypothetical protein
MELDATEPDRVAGQTTEDQASRRGLVVILLSPELLISCVEQAL